jgi:SAM-dependent methyltransferase
MQVTAVDDLQDAWHRLDGNQEKIFSFAKSVDIEYIIPTEKGEFSIPDKQYDVLMAHDVLEHLHTSPRVLLNRLLQYIKPGGIMAITVPNAANLRKRIHLLFGRTNYAKYAYYYWYPGLWRGHIREYVRGDLILMNQYLDLELLELTTFHLQLDALPAWACQLFVILSNIAPGFRDSWMLISRKPEDWKPRFRPNSVQFAQAFREQYFNYFGVDFDWEE